MRASWSWRGARLASLVALWLSASCGSDDSPKRDAEDAGVEDAGASECNMQGVWALRWISYASNVAVAVSNNWFYLEVEQNGEELTVKESVDCGYRAFVGNFVTYSPPALERVLPQYNSQAGRKGTLRKAGEQCDLFLHKFWTVRGADPATYLPDGPFAETTLAAVQAKAPLPSPANPEGAEDWENDGNIGITLVIEDTGERYSTNRDWTEYFSCNGGDADPAGCRPGDSDVFALTPEALQDSFTVRSAYDGEDPPLASTSPLFNNDAPPLADGNHRGTFKRLGSGRDDGMARAFWAETDAYERCQLLRQWLPPQME